MRRRSDRTLKRDAVKARLAIAAPMVIAVGTLKKRKGFDVIIDALARVTIPATLVICGDGGRRGRLPDSRWRCGAARCAHGDVAGRCSASRSTRPSGTASSGKPTSLSADDVRTARDRDLRSLCVRERALEAVSLILFRRTGRNRRNTERINGRDRAFHRRLCERRRPASGPDGGRPSCAVGGRSGEPIDGRGGSNSPPPRPDRNRESRRISNRVRARRASGLARASRGRWCTGSRPGRGERQPVRTIPDYFAAADVFVHAGELEAAGNVVLEALAAACA